MSEKENTAEEDSAKLEFSPAQFTLVRESGDGRLCLFQDKDGHLTAVRADRLA